MAHPCMLPGCQRPATADLLVDTVHVRTCREHLSAVQSIADRLSKEGLEHLLAELKLEDPEPRQERRGQRGIA